MEATEIDQDLAFEVKFGTAPHPEAVLGVAGSFITVFSHEWVLFLSRIFIKGMQILNM